MICFAQLWPIPEDAPVTITILFENSITIPLLIFIPQFIGGLILILYNYIITKKKSHIKTKANIVNVIEFIQTEKLMNRPDSIKKIFLLVFLASYFNFLTILLGKHFFNYNTILKENDNDKFLEKRIRSMQIIITAQLCNVTLRINIYKHQKFSLIVIFVFLLIILSFEIFSLGTRIEMLLIFILHFIIRAFLDAIEKYLFEFNFMDIYKLLTYEGLFSIIFYSILYFIYSDYMNITNIYIYIKKNSENNDIIKMLGLLLLLILFMVCTGFRHIYRVNTIKLYTPMTLALFELLLDPVFVGYYFIKDCQEEFNIFEFWLYLTIITFCLIIMSFFSLVYNDFLVLYCYGLEKDTYLEIKHRSLTNFEINKYEDEDDDNNSIKNVNKIQIEIPKK